MFPEKTRDLLTASKFSARILDGLRRMRGRRLDPARERTTLRGVPEERVVHTHTPVRNHAFARRAVSH